MELKTIEKALKVFKCFAQAETSISTTELAKRLGVNMATMSRLLTTLNHHDFLERDLRTRRYRLGPAIAELARAWHRALDGKLTAIASPYINALRDTIDETIALEVLYGNNLYHAYVAQSSKPVSLRVEPGDRVMPHAHVGSKAIIAFSEPDVIDHWLNQDLPIYTPNTVTDPVALRRIYEEIRNTGVSFDFGEYVEEIDAIGAPVFNHENKPVAGLVIAVLSNGTRHKWDQNHLFQLKTTANEISSRLMSSRNIQL